SRIVLTIEDPKDTTRGEESLVQSGLSRTLKTQPEAKSRWFNSDHRGPYRHNQRRRVAGSILTIEDPKDTTRGEESLVQY
ncbi:hypothetical protein BgiMline_005296, partial [Biomphalaria glabrata]